MNPLLKTAELLYRGINRLRRALYRRGVLRPKRLPRPVISVGSRAVGGSGKTPAVIAIANFLASRGLKVAVLTRGYGRTSAEQGVVTSNDAAKYGDEPVLIKASTTADIIVGADRYQNGAEHSCDVFLLDDGFQHLQLHRDVDVVIEADARFLREGRSSLKDADIVIPRRLRVAPVDAKRVFAFAGLADNQQFFRGLPNVVGTRSFRDHHRYTASDVAQIKKEARDAGADLIVTTEKDAVKINDRDIIPLRAEFVIEPEILEKILRLIR